MVDSEFLIREDDAGLAVDADARAGAGEAAQRAAAGSGVADGSPARDDDLEVGTAGADDVAVVNILAVEAPQVVTGVRAVVHHLVEGEAELAVVVEVDDDVASEVTPVLDGGGVILLVNGDEHVVLIRHLITHCAGGGVGDRLIVIHHAVGRVKQAAGGVESVPTAARERGDAVVVLDLKGAVLIEGDENGGLGIGNKGAGLLARFGVGGGHIVDRNQRQFGTGAGGTNHLRGDLDETVGVDCRLDIGATIEVGQNEGALLLALADGNRVTINGGITEVGLALQHILTDDLRGVLDSDRLDFLAFLLARSLLNVLLGDRLVGDALIAHDGGNSLAGLGSLGVTLDGLHAGGHRGSGERCGRKSHQILGNLFHKPKNYVINNVDN